MASWKRFVRDRHYRIINWKNRHMEMRGYSRVVNAPILKPEPGQKTQAQTRPDPEIYF